MENHTRHEVDPSERRAGCIKSLAMSSYFEALISKVLSMLALTLGSASHDAEERSQRTCKLRFYFALGAFKIEARRPTYGDQAWIAASMSTPTSRTPCMMPDLLRLTIGSGPNWSNHGTRFSHLYPYVESEARYACCFEVALKATDFIAHRTRLTTRLCPTLAYLPSSM